MIGMSDTRIPVTLFTGFLGSGKTTLLNRLIGTPAFEHAAVVINEFGEMAIDHLLVASPMEHLVVLDNGCICCSARGDLAGALRTLARGRAQGVPAFDRVLVETTGLADPVPLMETLCEDADMADRFRPHGVVTMVDGINAAAQLDEFAEPVKQVAIADRLLVSKPDLAPADALARLEARLRTLNPGAPIVRVVTTEADAMTALGPAWTPEAEGAFDWFARAEQVARASGGPRGEHLARSDSLQSFTLWHDAPVTRAGLVLWLDKLAGLRGSQLLRVKGVLNVEGEPVAVHAVQRIVHEPIVLARWPDDERRSRLVFITRGLERQAVERTLDALGFALGSGGGRFVDPQAYARFVTASGRFR
jgi:G3E family GTPase